MNGQCDNVGCTRPATVGVVKDAAYSLHSAVSNSKWIIKLCEPCAEQEARMRDDGLVALDVC